MDRDTFWETFRDIFFLVAKIIIVFVVLQVILIASGSEMKLPIVHKYMLKVMYWWKENFQGIKFGV